MKTNWRPLSSVLADILSSREKLVAAANEIRAQPGMEGDPLPTGGDIDSGSPTRATGGEARDGKGNRTRSADKWVIRPPGKSRGANAPAKWEEQNVKEPGPSPKARPVLRVGVDGKRLDTAQQCGCPAAVVSRRLTFSNDAHGSSAPSHAGSASI
jgi:hypothetical protein